MDAAQKNTSKIALFLAIALLLMAPVHGFAQVTLVPATTTVNIGNASCNDNQTVLLNSSDATSTKSTNITFTVAVRYNSSTPNTGDAYGNWLYATIYGAGTTSTGTTYSTSTGSTGAGTSLVIGLNNTSITASSDTATVVLTPTGPAGVSTTPIAITVIYQASNSCGGNTGSASNGDITVTPGNIALAAALGATNTQTLVIQNSTGSTLGFTVSTNGGGTWLQYQYNSLTIAPNNGQTPLQVIGNGANVSSAGTYTGSIVIQACLGTNPCSAYGSAVVIPVTFVVGGGTGTGTGTSGTLTVGGTNTNTSSVTFNYVAPPPLPGPQLIPIQDTAVGADFYTYTVTTTSGGSWLLANGNTSGNTTALLAPGDNASVTLSLSNVADSLSSGSYQGSVALTSSSGATATLNVYLYVAGSAAPGITVSPSQIVTFPGVTVGSTVLQQQQITVSAASGYSLQTASLSTTSVFTISAPVFTASTEVFTVTANPASLVAGVYSATITIPSSGTTAGTTSILVSLPVGQTGNTTGTGTGTGTVTSAIAPTTLNFQEQQGSTYWNNQQTAQTVTITGQQGSAWSAAIIYGGNSGGWLNLNSPALGSGTFGSGPASLVVGLFNGVTSLAPGTYTATIDITTPSGTTAVSVSLVVTAANTPVLFGTPSLLTFSSNSGTVPASQSALIDGTDNPSSTSSPTITAGTPTQSWITATTSANTLTISTNPSGQATGVYSGTVPITVGGGTTYPNTLYYPVVLVVNGGTTSSTGPLTLSTTSIPFTNVTGVLSNTLDVSASSTTTFTATTSEQSCGTNWLTISPGGTLSATNTSATAITVSVNPSGISNGTTCNGSVLLTTSSSQTQVVSISMTVGTAATGGNVTVTPTTMSFAYTEGQTAPVAQTASIANATSGTSPISFTVTTAVQNGVSNWLSTNAGSSTETTPFSLSISAAPGNLAASTTPYTGTVTITPTGGTAQVINVSLTVTAVPTVTATPTSISLSYSVGGTSPTSTIQVSAGGSTANFTATAASSGGWLAVTQPTGPTPNTGTYNLTVSLVSSALSTLLPNAPGNPYTGTITIQGTSPAIGTTIINVTLNITAPLPAITGIINAASGAVGSISPGEVISLFANAANPIGPAIAVTLNSTTCLSPCTQIPTTMGGVQVIFLPGSVPAPLISVSSGQINAVVPYQIAGVSNLSVEVKYLGQSSNAFPVTGTTTAPGIFTANQSGTGPAAVLQYNPQGVYEGVNTPSNQATKGWYLVIYMTGEGVVNPAATTGAVTQVSATPPTTPQPFFVPIVTIGSQPATVAYYGEAAGLVSGVLQVNAIVPPAAPTGAVSLSVTLGTASSQAGVTVYLN